MEGLLALSQIKTFMYYKAYLIKLTKYSIFAVMQVRISIEIIITHKTYNFLIHIKTTIFKSRLVYCLQFLYFEQHALFQIENFVF